MSASKDLGKLKSTLKERCDDEDCKGVLQIRTREISIMVRGEDQTMFVDYKCCTVCGYEEPFENKKRKMVFDKTAFVKEEIIVPDYKNDRRNNYGAHNQRSRTSYSHGAKGFRSS